MKAIIVEDEFLAQEELSYLIKKHSNIDIVATFEDGQQIRARYLIGADGMHSTVRDTAGIPFRGDTYEESFVLADVRMSGGVPENEVILYFSPAGLAVVAPLPDGYYRIVATVDEAPPVPDRAFVQQLVSERGPRAHPIVIDEVLWGSRFRVHHRIADSFRAGRILLAGDAAHVHSPAGGQGMNLGIDDGVTLAEALARVGERAHGEPTAPGPWAGRRVVISTGGTREPLDPVRFLGNRSSGRMGMAVARAARDLGAEVTLVSGLTALAAPPGVRRVDVETALEMQAAVEAALPR